MSKEKSDENNCEMETIPLHDSDAEEEEETKKIYNIKDANHDALPERDGMDFEDEVKMNEYFQTNLIAWRDSYLKLMDQSIKRVHMLIRTQRWIEHEPPPKCLYPHIKLYERQCSPSQGYYTLKVEAVLQCRAERLHYVIRDHNLETRMRWDATYLVDIGQHESYLGKKETVDVAYSEVNLGIPGVANRYMLGIHWNGYNEENDSYTYVFKTTCHQTYRCPDDKVNALGLIGTVVRTFDNPLQCQVIMAVHLNPGDKFPALLANQLKEWLRDRMARYEYVVKHWNQYYKRTDDPTKIENRK